MNRDRSRLTLVPMRVLHLYSGNLYGGVERVLATLARCRGLCPAMEPAFGLCFDGALADELRATGAAVALLGGVRLSRPWTLWRARRRLADWLAEQRRQHRPPEVAVCHSYWPHAAFAPVVRKAGLLLAFAAHDVPDGRHWLQRWARRTNPDLVLANSRATRAAVPRLFPGVPCEAIPCPLPAPPPPDTEGQQRQRAAARAQWGAGEGTIVILMACRLESYKGHLPLLHALARLRDVPGWACWIAGGVQRPKERAYLEQLTALARRERLDGRVHFLGQRADVPRLMAGADVHCQPNVGPEPFGLAFVEALDAGLPVVTSAIGGGAEVVDSSCGVLVPPGDAPALAEALRRLIGDPARRAALGANGRRRARLLCDPAGVLPRWAEALARLARADARITRPGVA